MKVKSRKPGKQRKALYNLKNHQRSKLMNTRLADFLTEEYGIKKLPLRVGDQVKVTVGEFKDFEGEVIEINRKTQRVKIKECAFEKVDGTQFHPSIHVSNLLISKFKREGRRMDPWRARLFERKVAYGLVEPELEGPKKTNER